MAKQFFIDQDSGQFVVAPNSSNRLSPVSWQNKDLYALEFYFLRQTGVFGRPFSYQDRSTATISVGLGLITAAAVASATSFANLTSSVTPTVSVIQGGTSIASEIQKISFTPKAGGGVWAITVPNDSRTISSTVTAGVFVTTANHGFVINEPVIFSTITSTGISLGTTYYVYDLQAPDRFRIASTSGGTVMTAVTGGTNGTVATPARTTSLLNSYAEASDVQASLRALDTVGTTGVEVLGAAGDYFYISATGPRVNSDFPTMTVVNSLTPPYGKTGAFNLSVAGLDTLLTAETDKIVDGLILEVEVNDIISGITVRESYTMLVVEDIL